MKMALVISFTMAVTLACAFNGLAWQGDFRQLGIRVKPTPEMLAGYAGAELCSGKRGDIRKIEWYVIPGWSFQSPKGDPLFGYADGKRIYLAGEQAHRVWLSRHEALHTLGFGDHPESLFVGRCKAHWPSPSDTL